MNTCLECLKETNNPKFCSRTCSAIYNNKRTPKRKVEGTCKICGLPVRKKYKYCKEHRYYVGEVSLGEAVKRYAKHHRSSAFALVRHRARKATEERRVCENCGYDKHVEVCHRKAIALFDEDTPISTINDPSNLVVLCPNCHWEFDNGLLKL